MHTLEQYYRRLNRFIPVRDASGLNDKDDIRLLKMWGIWVAIEQYNGTGNIDLWITWKTKRFVMDHIRWKKITAGRDIQFKDQKFDDEEWPPPIPVESMEEHILAKMRIRETLKKATPNQKAVFNLLQEQKAWSNYEISAILGLSVQRIDQLVRELKNLFGIDKCYRISANHK